jgi:hypothetical protein
MRAGDRGARIVGYTEQFVGVADQMWLHKAARNAECRRSLCEVRYACLTCEGV